MEQALVFYETKFTPFWLQQNGHKENLASQLLQGRPHNLQAKWLPTAETSDRHWLFMFNLY